MSETIQEKKSPLKLLQNYLKESYSELRKVAWPSRKQALQETLVVIIISAAVAVFLGALDIGFGTLINFLISQ